MNEVDKDLLTLMIESGEVIQIRKFINYGENDYLYRNIKHFMIKDLNLYIEVSLNPKRSMAGYNHRWYIKESIPKSTFPYKGFDRIRKDIDDGEAFDILKNAGREDLIKLIIFNIDELAG